MKITDEMRRKMLEEVLSKHHSPPKVAEEFHMDHADFKRLSARAREHGVVRVRTTTDRGKTRRKDKPKNFENPITLSE